MKKWLNKLVKLWPLYAAGVVCILNIDWVIIPSLTHRYFSIFGFKLINLEHMIPPLSAYGVLAVAESISFLEQMYWYWFWGWLGFFIIALATDLASKKESIQEGIELGRRIEKELERKGYIEKVKKYFVRIFHWSNDPDNKFLKRLRRGGYVSVFVLAISPEPMARTVATIFCRSLGSKLGLAILLVGDFFKNCYMVGGWSLIISFFRH